MALRGVNLGNWLVLEKWMGDSPLSRATAEDDRALIDELGDAERAHALGEHYRTYVSEKDFAWMAQAGVELVRIPVPYHLFGSPHHVGCVEHLDRAFDWARTHGLRVLLDLHTVPLSQNGFDNGGYTGLCAWGRDPERRRATLDLLERMAARYAGDAALWGIEPMNEPVSLAVFVANVPKVKHHPDRIVRSRPLSQRALKAFYQQFYERVRPVVGPGVKLVFHDRFSLRAWDDFDPGCGDDNVWMDTHQYVGFADGALASHDLGAYLALVGRMAREVKRASAYHGVLVGEWSLANHATYLEQCSEQAVRAWYRAYAHAQLSAWDVGGASCFWSLRVKGTGRANWSFESCVCNGWLDFSRRG